MVFWLRAKNRSKYYFFADARGNMESMQVRIDNENMKALNELAKMLSSSRSEVIRR